MATDLAEFIVRRSVLNSFLVFRCCRARCCGDRDFPDFNAATSRAKTAGEVIGGLLLFVAAAYIVELIFPSLTWRSWVKEW